MKRAPCMEKKATSQENGTLLELPLKLNPLHRKMCDLHSEWHTYIQLYKMCVFKGEINKVNIFRVASSINLYRELITWSVALCGTLYVCTHKRDQT